MTESPPGMPEEPDPARMLVDRHARLQAQLAVHGLDGMILLGTSAVRYATGWAGAGADPAAAALWRPVAVVVGGDRHPHLAAAGPPPPGLPPDHHHPPLLPDLDGGAARVAPLVRSLFASGAHLAVDELPHPMAAALRGYRVAGAAAALGGAKVIKTPDELACIRAAQRINEAAMAQVAPMAVPGVGQWQLTAAFNRLVTEHGAGAVALDPIWQPMPARRGDGPWTVHGGVAFPTGSDGRVLRRGDVVWVDTGICYHGYASDFGRTWIVGDPPRPTARQRAQHRRWKEVVEAVLAVLRPGATGLDLVRAATAAHGGARPWLEHFYLAHGVGTDSAEAPLVGTDLGEGFDASTVLAPGMVVVLEPVIWDEGDGGYRAEDIYAVTPEGWVALSDHPYHPFES
ncbi:MAG TPA: M24 family metallopeptidase [Acidimicrobiales bacterium]|nr:M24 family metallopeptidase [Acidimicrobiales bacterium]